jgi:peptidyl-tRNA hydrolase, PTH1 family
MAMWLVVGLGNPGAEYAKNRHNVGFMVVDRLVERWKAPALKDKFSGRFTKVALGKSDEAVLLTPLTYMNLSGESVRKAMDFFKVPLSNVLVIHDEMDLPFRDVRVKVGGGAAGHNGLKSILQHAGADFVRLRIGVGRPARGSSEDWVLGNFDVSEGAELPDVLHAAALAAESVVLKGPAAAQNSTNTKAPAKKANAKG